MDYQTSMNLNNKNKRIHFISIGGAAMHSLALALDQAGWKVTGSDDEIRDPSRGRLEKAGLLPDSDGWDPSRVDPGLDAVILGMHARGDNPELARARELGIRIYSFPEFLYQRSRDRKRVVVGGSHGKTTVTSIILHVLNHEGIDCDFLVGAKVDGFDNLARLDSGGDLAVFEGDEYLSSPLDPLPKFLHYRPHLAVLTGIAWDHINVFPDYQGYLQQFREFVSRIEPSGRLVYCSDDPEVRRIADAARPDIVKIPYSTHPYEVRAGRFFLMRKDKRLLPLQLFGRHNMQNISAAAKVCSSLGVSAEDFYLAIQSFRGASRRLQRLGEGDDFTVYLDFAHAPSKVKATVDAVRELHPDRSLVACLELHTYSSLSSAFLSQYRGSLDAADSAVVFFDPAAVRLKRLQPLAPDEIRAGFQHRNLTVMTSAEELEEWSQGLDLDESSLLFMSSGNFGGFKPAEIPKLKGRGKPER